MTDVRSQEVTPDPASARLGRETTAGSTALLACAIEEVGPAINVRKAAEAAVAKSWVDIPYAHAAAE